MIPHFLFRYRSLMKIFERFIDLFISISLRLVQQLVEWKYADHRCIQVEVNGTGYEHDNWPSMRQDF